MRFHYLQGDGTYKVRVYPFGASLKSGKISKVSMIHLSEGEKQTLSCWLNSKSDHERKTAYEYIIRMNELLLEPFLDPLLIITPAPRG